MLFPAAPFEADVYRAVVPSNTGIVPTPRKPMPVGRKSRVDVLKQAIKEYPNLIRVVEGIVRNGAPLDRFERRPVELHVWEGLLERIAGDDVVTTFGAWCDWNWPPVVDPWVEPLRGPSRLHDGNAWDVEFLVDVQKLKAYADLQQDSRPEQVESFLALCEAHGKLEAGGLTVLEHQGRQKLVNGSPLGRHFFVEPSYPLLSRRARAAAYPASAVEFDMPNAVVHFAVQVGSQLGLSLPLMKKYVRHKESWRKAVAEFLGLSPEDSKKMLLKACYGYAFSSAFGGHACPLLDGLAAEGLELKEAVCSANPQLLEAMRAGKRLRPETSTLAMKLMDLENKWMLHFVSLLQKHHYRLVATVYDAVVAVPNQDWVDADQNAIIEEFQRLCGLRMQVTKMTLSMPSSGSGISQMLDSIVSAGQGVQDEVAMKVEGNCMCIPSAVVNVFPETAEHVTSGLRDESGPFSYGEFLEFCPQICLEPISVSDDSISGHSFFLLHETGAETSQYGHAFGVKVAGGQVLVSSSNRREIWRLNGAAFWERLRKLSRPKLFRTEVC